MKISDERPGTQIALASLRILLVLSLLCSCGRGPSEVHSDQAVVTVRGELPRIERKAWDELARTFALRNLPSEIEIVVRAGTASIGELNYRTGDPMELKRALHKIAVDRIKKIPPGKSLDVGARLAELMADEHADHLSVMGADAATLYDGALQAGVLGFYFQTMNGSYPAPELAARSLVLEAISRAADPALREDRLLAAFQCASIGRPDVSLRLLEGDERPAAVSLRRYLRSEIVPNADDAPPCARPLALLAFKRDERNLTMHEAEEILKPCPRSWIARYAVARYVDVVEGHHVSSALMGRAAGRAIELLGEANWPAETDMEEDEALTALARFGKMRAREETDSGDPLVRALADGYVTLGVSLRLDFLYQRYGHEPSAREFERKLIEAIGEDLPIVRYYVLWKRQPNENELSAWIHAVEKQSDQSRIVGAISHVHGVNQSKALEMYNHFAETLDDSNVNRISQLAQVSYQPFYFRKKWEAYVTRGLSIDPYDPELYVLAPDSSFEMAEHYLPKSLRVILDRVERLGGKDVAYETDMVAAVAYLHDALKSDSNPSLIWSYGSHCLNLGYLDSGLAAWRTWFDQHEVDDVEASNYRAHYGWVLMESGRWDEAEKQLQRARQSWAAEPIKNYAMFLECRGRVAEAEIEWLAAVKRYPATWWSLVVFYDRIGKQAKADELLKEKMPELVGWDRGNFCNFCIIRRPQMLMRFYAKKLLDRTGPFDDGDLAAATMLARNEKEALAILDEGWREGRRNPTVFWFRYGLMLRVLGVKAADEFLKANAPYAEDKPYHATLLKVMRGTLDPAEAEKEHRETFYYSTYLSHLYPLVAFRLEKLGRKDEAAIWFDKAVRIRHFGWYLPMLARKAKGLPIGEWWVMVGPRAAGLKKSGLIWYF